MTSEWMSVGLGGGLIEMGAGMWHGWLLIVDVLVIAGWVDCSSRLMNKIEVLLEVVAVVETTWAVTTDAVSR